MDTLAALAAFLRRALCAFDIFISKRDVLFAMAGVYPYPYSSQGSCARITA